jgi:hypothetical protein
LCSFTPMVRRASALSGRRRRACGRRRPGTTSVFPRGGAGAKIASVSLDQA